MEKVIVNKDACIKCGSCVSIAPETFDFDDDGASSVINATVTEEAKNAKDCCPTGAIDIIKEDSK